MRTLPSETPVENIVRFVSKSELERERLIREARAIYDSIFPPVTSAGVQDDDQTEPRTSIHPLADREP